MPVLLHQVRSNVLLLLPPPLQVLRNEQGTAPLLREMLYDPGTGGVRTTRLSALMNAALGYVAEETSGFIDFDAVPEQGASLQVGRGCAGVGVGACVRGFMCC